MKNKTSKHILTAVIFLFFITLFFYLTFPTESLKKRIVAEIENNSGYKAEIVDVDFSPFIVLNVQSLKLTSEKDQVEILVDNLKISPSLFSLFLQNKKLPYVAKIGEGEIEGVIAFTNNGNRLSSFSANLDNVDSDIVNKFFKDKKNMPRFGGDVSGEIDMVLVKDGVKNIKGSFELYSENFSISNLRIESFTIPKYQDLQAALEGEIETNTTRLNRLQLENKDFNLSLSGTMPLLWKMRRGMLDLSVNLVLNTKEAKIGFLQAFMNKRNDGTLTAKIGGTFNKPQFIKGGTL